MRLGTSLCNTFMICWFFQDMAVEEAGEEAGGGAESSDEEVMKLAALQKYQAFTKMHSDILDPGNLSTHTNTHTHTRTYTY